MEVKEWLGESNTIGIDIWNKKYRHNDETFDAWLDRVSGNDKYIRQLIVDKKFLFAGRILAGRGCIDKDNCKMTLSNCYVLPPVEDNLESIFDTGKYLGRTYSYGGGVGMDISKLAPKNARVRNAASKSSGAVSFMELYSLITGLIAQCGRRGALMLSMKIDHPDIEEFITIKNNLDKVTKANISVRITDEFMRAVKQDEDYELYYKREETGEEIKKIIKAQELFALICQQAWDNAEPGVLFWDRVLNYNLMEYDDKYEIVGVNPCGELPLNAGGACLLGSINLAEFVKEDKSFDFEEFRGVVFEAIRALNDVLDEGVELHPLQMQRDAADDWRPIGLGIMGLADMLIKMEITYGSEKSIKLCDMIGQLMGECAITQSIEEAENHGSFPNCDNIDIIQSEFFDKHAHPTAGTKVIESGIRNSQLIAIAPTGSLSTMLNISGGIEPIFDLYYKRKTETLNDEDKYYNIYTQIVWDYMQTHGIQEGEEDKLPEWFVTARNIDYKDRIKMQGVWQSHVDNSISSTVNLPNSATVEDVMDLYMLAWEEGCKGVTIFREGCKRAPILDSKKENTKPKSMDLSEMNGRLIGDFMKQIKDNISVDLKKNIAKEREELLKSFHHPSEHNKHNTIQDDYRFMVEMYERIPGIKTMFKRYNLNLASESDKENVEKICKLMADMSISDPDKYEQMKDIVLGSYSFAECVYRLSKIADIEKYNPKNAGSPIKDFMDLVKSDDTKQFYPHAENSHTLKRGEVIKAPQNSIGKCRDLMTGCGSLHFQAFFDVHTGEVVQTYLSKGSNGGCNSFMVGLSRMISLSGRAGVDVRTIADQLNSAPACPSYVKGKCDKANRVSRGSSCPIAIGYALIDMYEEVMEEIELGGVHTGTPLYYRLKAKQLETAKQDVEKEIDHLNFTMPESGLSLDRTQFIKGPNEEFSVEASKPTFKKTPNQLLLDYYADKFTEIEDREIREFLNNTKKEDDVDNTAKCPDCGAPLTFEGGCNTCKQCGYSKCD